MKVSAYASTHVGTVREINEDFYLLEPELNLYLVCDGMGGHAAGEVASSQAGGFVLRYLKTHQPDITYCHSTGDATRLEQLIVQAVKYACIELNDLSLHDLPLAGMGTTLTLAMLVDERAVMAHVGDSQLYQVRGNQIFLRSHDHTLAAELLATGVFEDPHQVKDFQHVLTRSLGPTSEVEVETCILDLSVGDTLLLCTDGLSHSIACKEELLCILEHGANQATADSLIDLAIARGGKDNVTVIVLQLSEPTFAPPLEEQYRGAAISNPH